MQLPELQRQLVEKTVQPFYLFVGEEVGIMDSRSPCGSVD